MRRNTIEFLATAAFFNVEHRLSVPSFYGIDTHALLFNLITGDTPFDKLPIELQEDIGSESDLINLSEDLLAAYSIVVFTIRLLGDEANNQDIIRDVAEVLV